MYRVRQKMAKETIKIDEQTINQWMKDLEKYGQKLNAMMVESARGTCPQVFKILLIKKLIDFTADQFKVMDKKEYKKAVTFVDQFMAASGHMESLDKTEYEAKYGSLEER